MTDPISPILIVFFAFGYVLFVYGVLLLLASFSSRRRDVEL